MAETIHDAAPLVVKALQQWYGADRFASHTGLYSYRDPALDVHWRDLSRTGRNIANGLIALLGQRHRIQDTARWWNSANAVTAVIDYMAITGDRSYLAVVENTFTKAPRVRRRLNARRLTMRRPLFGLFPLFYPGFINGFYDDEGWWALAWIEAYQLTGDERYLAAARDIFLDMAEGWDDIWGGGIYWGKYDGRPDRTGAAAVPHGWQGPYKNAIANELFIAVAASLSLRYRQGAAAGGDGIQAECAQHALRAWEWFSSPPPKGVGMINENNLINDSPSQAGVNHNTESVWSYNQGVILGGLADLSEITGDDSYLRQAEATADAFIGTPWYTAGNRAKPPPSQSGVIGGVLHEHNECGPEGSPTPGSAPPGVDSTLFKGIFVRSLARLYLKTPKATYREFILTNAQSALAHMSQGHLFGCNWAAPVDVADFVRQTAGLDLVNAALLVTRDEPAPAPGAATSQADGTG